MPKSFNNATSKAKPSKEAQLELSNLNRTRKARTVHGGSLSRGKRKSKRPIAIRQSLHVVLKSERAKGQRALIHHALYIEARLKSAAYRFGVRIYGRAIHFNHIHLHVRGTTRIGLQNFFRVVAGHIAQEILNRKPLTPSELAQTHGTRKFWQDLVFSRLVTWGRDFRAVKNYLIKNGIEVEEALAQNLFRSFDGIYTQSG